MMEQEPYMFKGVGLSPTSSTILGISSFGRASN